MTSVKLENFITSYIPLPVCVIDRNGKIISAGDKIGEVFLYDNVVDADIFAITGIKAADLFLAADNGTHHLLNRNGKIFKLICQRVDGEEPGELTILFEDVTSLEELKDKYNAERLCIGKIQIDNYDELIANTPVGSRISLPNEIDKLVRKWAEKISASINKMNDDSYLVAVEQQYLDKVISAKFDILDEVRKLDTEADFPVSLSIGMGAGGKTAAQTEEYADAALDLALGRGGDQAVLKRNMKIEYYGGKLQTVEKRNKGKSRIVGHALKQLIDQSKRIFIMGHANPDMDCFGASLGVMRLCAANDKEPYIVIDNYKEAMQAVFKQAKENGNYKFISSERAKTLADKDSLVIVVDTHRPSMVQCPELLSTCEKKVIIDHHRRVEDFIENPVLAYMESYASSASELVAEIRESGDFCIGGACYPEGHVEAANQKEDILNLKKKVEAGCDYLVTQMFFDNNILYSFLYRLREQGITVPVVAGIMPVTNGKQIKRITSLSGTYLPARFKAIVDRFGDDSAAMKQAGIAYATEQIIDLIANGVNGIHVYSMNKPEVARAIQDNLSQIIK